MLRFKKFSFWALIVFLFAFFLAPAVNQAQAGATLFLSPKSGTYTVGQNFTVTIMVNSGGGVGINAAEGIIKFDPNYLLVTGVSKTGSIFSLWTSNNGQGPGYNNKTGEVNFGGGAPTAYVGQAGNLFTITFNALKTGTTKVKFSSGMALAADGKGTNVLSGYGSATYTIQEKQAKKPEEKNTPAEKKPSQETKKPRSPQKTKSVTEGVLPPLPRVQSSTHPNESTWYANNNPEISWKLLSDVTAVSFTLDHNPDTDPGPKPKGVVESKKYENVTDGEWYFHIKYKNKSGWGEVAHRKVLIDVTPPEPFTLSVDNGGDPTNPAPLLKFKTEDKTSGIDHYKITINDEEKEVTPTEVKNGAWQLPKLPPGEYEVKVIAVDKAKNEQSAVTKVIIEPLRSPVITYLPRTITSRAELTIRGASFYPQSTIHLYIAAANQQPQEYTTKTDEEGDWSFFLKKHLPAGTYEIWAKLVDKRGAESYPTTKEILDVVKPSIIELYGLYIILGLIFVILLLLLFIFAQRRQFKKELARIRRETEEVRTKMAKVFAALREEVDEVMEYADKRAGMSEGEKRVRDKLHEALDISEEFMQKEVEDVEKEIK